MKRLKLLLVAVFLVFGFSSCEYTFWVPEDVIDPTDPNADVISFSETIQPIFTNNCVSCHKTGGQLPDLSSGNAYSSINTSRYINRTSPAESLIYTHPDPTNTGTHTQMKYTAAQAAYVLGWITQGAENN